ncbi:hypothetical protein K402DRAFT_419551 [Aulographum hederae CBS 113979]|uniref:RRM domain-containing protein n=1 Tax=Aulographum hederae CBS 113979 TaxID=1176131 RepID=A0A6G1H4Q3_9PEZI|nr:hypothetical protein K402DRAFT_419551 [Aulographum hederae CBS 113979]
MPSPPQEPPEFRGQTLTPVSPKPLLFPSPANIPILEQQMDPNFNDQMSNGQYPSLNASLAQDNDSGDAQHEPSFAHSQQQQQHDTSQDSSNQHDGAYSGDNAGGHTDVNNAHSLAHLNAEVLASHNQQSTSFAPDTQPNQSLVDASREAPAASATGSAQQQQQQQQQLPNSAHIATDYSAVSHQAHAPTESQSESPMANASSGGVDLQMLLDKLASATPTANAPTNNATFSASASTSPTALTGNPSLPPRPPPQAMPSTHPNYSPGDDIRNYHPHSQTAPGASYRAQDGLPALTVPGTAPAPVAASGSGAPFQQPRSAAQSSISPISPSYRQRDSLVKSESEQDWDNRTFDPDMDREYNTFLKEESAYVADGQWDKFPVDSRLFVGNLPSEKVSKREIFDKFRRYGKLAQISIKQAYGFVQFLEAEACSRALLNEQGMMLGERKIHLELSKPQKNTAGRREANGRRRSRSPDHGRGAPANSRNVDRYVSGQGASGGAARGGRGRNRDDYRPGRSPSPRGYGRDDYYRSRSRSPPYGRDYRSPPRFNDDDGLPLPRRAPRDVPDVQILVLESLDRDFIAYVEKAFHDRGIRADVLMLSPRLSEPAVIRRQVIEGVGAISKLTRANQQSGNINLTIFDRRGGVDRVDFMEYDFQTPQTMADLFLQTKRAHAQPQYPTHQGPQYGAPQQSQQSAYASGYGMPPGQARPGAANPRTNPQLQDPQVQQLLSQLGGTDIQRVLASLQQSGGAAQNTPNQYHAAQQYQAPTGITPDLARLLGTSNAVAAPAAAYAPPTPVSENPYRGGMQSQSLAGMFAGGQAGQQQQQHGQQSQQSQQQPDMNEIMAQLSRYKR